VKSLAKESVPPVSLAKPCTRTSQPLHLPYLLKMASTLAVEAQSEDRRNLRRQHSAFSAVGLLRTKHSINAVLLRDASLASNSEPCQPLVTLLRYDTR
jgi:hypothetical protein